MGTDVTGLVDVEHGLISRHSNYLVYRNRGQTEQDFYVGQREDILRHVDGAWKIARRKVILDQTTLLAKNVSIFL